MPLQNLNKNYGKTNKEYEEHMQNATKNEEPLLIYVNGYCTDEEPLLIYVNDYRTEYKPVHKTREATNYGKVTGTIRASYLVHADDHTKVFMNNIEKARSIYIKI